MPNILKLQTEVLCIKCEGAGVQGGIGGFHKCYTCEGKGKVKEISVKDLADFFSKIKKYVDMHNHILRNIEQEDKTDKEER